MSRIPRCLNRIALLLSFTIVLLGATGLLVFAVPWTFRNVAAAWIGAGLCIAFRFLLLNRYAIAVCYLLAGFCLVRAIMLCPMMFPLSVPVESMELNNTTVAEALALLAKQKQYPPYWRFYIHDPHLADTPISVSLPDDSHLGSALDAITSRCDAKWQWCWRRHHGTESFPRSAAFYIFKEGMEPDRGFRDYDVSIDRFGITRF